MSWIRLRRRSIWPVLVWALLGLLCSGIEAVIDGTHGHADAHAVEATAAGAGQPSDRHTPSPGNDSCPHCFHAAGQAMSVAALPGGRHPAPAREHAPRFPRESPNWIEIPPTPPPIIG